MLFPATQIRLKPAMHDTSEAILQELTHQYVMVNQAWFNITNLLANLLGKPSYFYYYANCIL